MKKFLHLILLFFIFNGCKSLLESNLSDSNDLLNSVDTINLKEKTDINKSDQEFIKNLNLSEMTSIVIPTTKSYLIDQIIEQNIGDTMSLSNLSTQTLKLGKTLSYEYDVKEGEIIHYKFENNKSNKIDEILIFEGDELRFAHNKLKRNEIIAGSIKIIKNNKLVLKIMNKGIFKSNININLKKNTTKYKIQILSDSIIGTELITENKIDTLFIIDQNKNYSLTPYIDITNKPELSIPIIFSKDDNILGWGYWISLDQSDLDEYDKSFEYNSEEPLISYAKSEIFKKVLDYNLPITKTPYVEISLENSQKLKSSINSQRNYNFFVQKISNTDEKVKFFLNFKNYSKLYDFNITFKLVKVITKNKLIEKEKDLLENFTKIIKIKQ